MSGLDSEIIRHALETARANGYVQVKLKHGEHAFRATLDPETFDASADAADSFDEGLGFAAAEISDSFEVKAPCVGYFQAGKEILKGGATLTEGAHVGLIKALGIDNDVLCKSAGTIEEIMVKPGDPVQFGQVLLRVKR